MCNFCFTCKPLGFIKIIAKVHSGERQVTNHYLELIWPINPLFWLGCWEVYQFDWNSFFSSVEVYLSLYSIVSFYSIPNCYHWEGYGSIPIDTFLVGWTSIYQLFWGSLGTRVLTHPQKISFWLPKFDGFKAVPQWLAEQKSAFDAGQIIVTSQPSRDPGLGGWIWCINSRDLTIFFFLLMVGWKQ